LRKCYPNYLVDACNNVLRRGQHFSAIKFRNGYMHLKKNLLACVGIAALLLSSGCTVVSVATTAVSVASTAVGVGVAAGSAAVSATATVAKGAVSLGSAVIGDSNDDSK
jgi:hypothetical protein